MTRLIRPRRGVAAVLAMLFLVLFTTIAIGFYASTNISVLSADGDQRSNSARLGAESGLAALRTWLNTVGAQTNINTLYTALDNLLAGTSNMAGNNPTLSSVTVDGTAHTAIVIPGVSTVNGQTVFNWMPLSSAGDATRMLIWYNGTTPVAHIVGQAYGSDSGRPQRAFEYQFSTSGTFSGTGLMTAGTLSLSNGIGIEGSVTSLSTSTSTACLNITGGAMIHGNFNYVSGAAPPVYGYGTASTFITGTVSAMTNPPTMPVVSTSEFASWVPSATATGSQVINSSNASTLNSSGTHLANIRIKANTNPTIGNGAVIDGVIYLESPNTLTVGGGCTIKGVIVTDGNAPITPLPAVGSVTSMPSSCSITIANGATLSDLSTITATDVPSSFIPTGLSLAQEQAMGGACVLAPYYSLNLAGGSTTMGGTLAASQISLSNGYSGLIKGAVLNLSPTPFSMVGGTVLNFLQGSTTVAGISVGGNMQIIANSYSEVTP